MNFIKSLVGAVRKFSSRIPSPSPVSASKSNQDRTTPPVGFFHPSRKFVTNSDPFEIREPNTPGMKSFRVSIYVKPKETGGRKGSVLVEHYLLEYKAESSLKVYEALTRTFGGRMPPDPASIQITYVPTEAEVAAKRERERIFFRRYAERLREGRRKPKQGGLS